LYKVLVEVLLEMLMEVLLAVVPSGQVSTQDLLKSSA
jgi:hypothetical protein